MSILGNKQTLTVKRSDASQQITGHLLQPGTITTFTIETTVQPASKTDLDSLPEGRRTTETFKIYPDKELITADQPSQQNSDVVEYNGEDYLVIKVENWQNSIIPHYKAMMVKQNA